MFLPVLFLACVLTVYAEERQYDLGKAEELFEDFITKYGKVYPTQAEKQMRLEIFKENLKEINLLNAGTTKPVFGITKFSDLTKEEAKAYYTGFDPHLAERAESACKTVSSNSIITNDAPDEFNWVTQGAVGPVKNQGKCGSCWAFSTIGNIEGQYFIQTKDMKSFSEQQLVDCSKSNYGCNGGVMALAMSDMMTLGGIELESSYPYTQGQSTCEFDQSQVVVRLAGCTNYINTDEEKLKEILVQTGPLAICLNGDALYNYHGGIYPKDKCPEGTIDHAVLLVGYGSEDGQDYWLVKNSWGEEWGEEGYFRITRGENTCGIVNNFLASAILQFDHSSDMDRNFNATRNYSYL